MPTFDIVSEINWVEIRNACDQANKEITNRFDFRGSDSRVELIQNDKNLALFADDEFKLKQVYDILVAKFAKRNVDIRSLKSQDIEKIAGNKVYQKHRIIEGLDTELAKKIVKIIKESKIKIQASIQGANIRVSGAKKDSLQSAISMVKEKITDIPLQFINFRD